MAIFALIFAGDAICGAMKVPKPSFLSSLQENRMMAIMSIWLVGNMLSAQLLNTGAFASWPFSRHFTHLLLVTGSY
ncbi:unnamed protein product [Durusdinium trenchii]